MTDNTQQQNVDPAEVAKFEALASRWWDLNSEFKPLHAINPLRVNYIDERSPVAGKKVIDVGCGGGILSEGLAQRGADVTGIDMGKQPLEVARLHLHESKLEIDYQQSTAEEMADSHTEQYDVVACLEMIEHVPDPASVIKACAKLCKPGGDLYFSTINRNPKAYLMAVVGAEYLLKLLPKGTHDFAKFIRPSELSQFVRDAELELVDMIGLHYNPITKSYKLADGVDVNYMIHVHKPK
ncbi:3-demethylubiquinone-9 3-methyltransferase [Sinobacterium caligoides]|uniref:Ubiquinone biosynthesis O-methyltransferase n=1 Tax=Sinobacterium caligoides TaxID=933926 RepID=A0A3N2DZ95_9GAMM|nr:bifunctional 2-polyprenyl-6-hydroxyphenol methylase/3-demethylubiquinol 3-O-methyltransferase UbiG [Sinobacterium caligoides]ROS05140.1 3-demethylubiquinone-9 3-methyltransferase [Sinobacterium caligoides]